jgi:hypothetical protein
MVDHWIQAGSLHIPDCARWSTPGNNELLAYWIVAPFPADYLASLNNVLPIILFASASVNLARTFGLAGIWPHIVGMIVTCQGITFQQLVDNENDVAVAAAFLAASLYIFRFIQTRDNHFLLLGSTAIGLLAGVKFYALGYAVLATFLLIALTIATRGIRTAIPVVVIVGVALLMNGGGWYIRNAMVTGSPLYPKQFFGPTDPFTEAYPHPERSSLIGNTDPRVLPLFIKAIWRWTGPFHVAAFLACPLTFIGLIGRSLASRRATACTCASAWSNIGLGMMVLGSACVLAITPFAAEDAPGTLNQLVDWNYCPVRYGISFLSTATLAAAIVSNYITDASMKRLATMHVALEGAFWGRVAPLHSTVLCLSLLGLLFQITRLDWGRFEAIGDTFLIIGTLLGAAAAVGASVSLLPTRRRVLLLLQIAFWDIGVAIACALLASHWDRAYITHFDRLVGKGCLRELFEKPFTSKTFYVLTPRCYPYFGPHREFRVVTPAEVDKPDTLMQRLDDSGATFVITTVGSGAGICHVFEECVSRFPERYKATYTLEDVSVFQVVSKRRVVMTK